MLIEENGRILREDGSEVLVQGVRFSLKSAERESALKGRWRGYADLPRSGSRRLSTLKVYRIELDSGVWGLARFPALVGDQQVRVTGKGPLHFSESDPATRGRS